MLTLLAFLRKHSHCFSPASFVNFRMPRFGGEMHSREEWQERYSFSLGQWLLATDLGRAPCHALRAAGTLTISSSEFTISPHGSGLTEALSTRSGNRAAAVMIRNAQ